MIVKNKSLQASSNNLKSSKTTDTTFHGSMNKLLVSHDESMEDKIATVKTAQLVDKPRFEAAFKKLMKR